MPPFKSLLDPADSLSRRELCMLPLWFVCIHHLFDYDFMASSAGDKKSHNQSFHSAGAPHQSRALHRPLTISGSQSSTGSNHPAKESSRRTRRAASTFPEKIAYSYSGNALPFYSRELVAHQDPETSGLNEFASQWNSSSPFSSGESLHSSEKHNRLTEIAI